MASASPSTSKAPLPNKPKPILHYKPLFTPKRKEYKTIKTTLKYKPFGLVSPVTNRRIKDGETHPKIDVYWCELCKRKLTNPMAQLQHFSGVKHTQNELEAQKVKAKADQKHRYTLYKSSTATATPAKVTSTATATPAKVKKNIPPTPTKTHMTPKKHNKSKGWNYHYNPSTTTKTTTNKQQRGGFNLSRSNDTNSYPLSHAHEHSNFTHPLIGNNYTWQQQQQFGNGLYNNNIGLNQQSVSNLEMLQARLLRNEAELRAYQGQDRGSFWRN